MPDLLNDPELWRKRAAEARAIADGMSDAEARLKMLGVAASYERLAERAGKEHAMNHKSRNDSVKSDMEAEFFCLNPRRTPSISSIGAPPTPRSTLLTTSVDRQEA